jgi:POT family proton-dependent oligopeptide transporter
MLALFAACATFYAGVEQTGASFNLFAERYTDLGFLGWRMPAGVLQATNALFVILFAPAFAALWLALGRRGKDLSPPAKMAVGLVLMGVGFLVMYGASQYVIAGTKVLPSWLIVTYLLHVWGDLCLSPVGLSSMTKLAPQRFVGQAMGVWFLGLSLGNNLAGQLSREYNARNLQSLPGLFLELFWWGLAGAAVMLLLTPVLKRLMAGTK